MPAIVLIRELPVDADPRLRHLLDASEESRADRLGDPAAYVCAHALKRLALGHALGKDPRALRFTRRCTTCGSDRHGKPSLSGAPGIEFSLSYTREVAVVALSRAGGVGVDVEGSADADFAGYDRVTLASEEIAGMPAPGPDLLHARARIWARKEAILKATGHGLIVDPKDVVVSGPASAPALLRWTACESAPTDLALADVEVSVAGHAAAVAVLTPEPLELREAALAAWATA